MKNIFLTLAFSVVINALLFGQTPVAKNGALHIENGKIVNQHGAEPQLRGVSFSWSVWAGRKYYKPQVVDWLSKDFKVSIFRVAMAVQPAHGYLTQPDSQKNMVISLVDEAIKDGIYVLIDWHDHNSNQHVPQANTFFAEMSKKYAGVPNVIYEIWNEPAKIAWDTVKNYAQQVIPVIRKYDPDNLIVVGSPHWDQDVDVVAADPLTGFTNIAYSFHFYASDPNHQDSLRAKADKALKAGIPLMITEWGVGESTGNGKFDMKENKVWLDWVETNHLSWANWNLTDKKETTAFLMPGAPDTGGWTDEQLTPAGLYIRRVLQKLNK
ncbi:MAG: glycoside hydrolase family 5 protein [Mucilaginibacter sp.]